MQAGTKRSSNIGAARPRLPRLSRLSGARRLPRLARVTTTIATVLAVAGLFGAAAGATSEQAARHYYGSDQGELVLARAVVAGDEPRISRLIADGADPDAVGTDDITMLQFALEMHSPHALRALLAAGALPDRLGRAGRAPLHDAARLGDPRYTQILLAAGADPDVRVAYTQTTPLREACLAAEPATFEALVAGGADLDAADAAGDRALHLCARTDSGSLVLRLLELGADPRAHNSAGNTFQDYYFSFDESVLDVSARRQHRQAVRWLDIHHIELVAGAERYR